MSYLKSWEEYLNATNKSILSIKRIILQYLKNVTVSWNTNLKKIHFSFAIGF